MSSSTQASNRTPPPTQLGEVERAQRGSGGGSRWTRTQDSHALASSPLPELASLVPTSPRFAGGGDRRRGGYVLVLVAMMLFGLFAMAALVIDLGFARLAQRQMQSAADSAALEGLRGEGAVDYTLRQTAAEPFITRTFANNLDVPIEDPGSVDFGPVVTFSGGAGDAALKASQLMTVDATNVTTVQRRPSPLAANSFSVAVQRGGVVNGDFDLLAHGPSVPFLFARGSLLDRGRIGEGIATGGVARAITDRALVVGQPVNNTAGNEIYPGAIPIGYTLADWNGSRSDPRLVSPPRLVVGEMVTDVGVAALMDGFCCIFTTINGVDRVVGFGRIENGVALPNSVAVANVIGRRGSAWNQIDATVRDEVLTQNETIIGGLLVARLAPGN